MLVLAVLLLPPVRGVSQGTFFFRNWAIMIGGGRLDVPVYDSDGNRLFGVDYVAMLYGGATPESLEPARYLSNGQVMAPTPFTYVAPFGEIGYFNEPAIVFTRAVQSVDSWLQVRAWDVRLGGSYEEVVALGIGGYGESNIFLELGGNPAVPTTPGFLTGLQSFSLLPIIPEPPSYALLALGGAALWVLRRR